ncbi:MAG: zf-HC2 domain-containing protein [Acidobacteria bacterium]|nr:zf-HC2 domain-containing protein [Acidobacteriota bacterium]
MQLEYDKEIDSLLRREARRPITIAEAASAHLDADELAAFAENALPERSRQAFTRHLADCDRCRKILSETMSFETHGGKENAAAAVVAAGTVIPWYRKVLGAPNLAYVMGGLVLVFACFLGYSLLRTQDLQSGSEISQAVETQPGGPNAAGKEPAIPLTEGMNSTSNSATANSNAAISANFSANRAGNTNGAGSAAAKPIPETSTSVANMAANTQANKDLVTDGVAEITAGQGAEGKAEKRSEKERSELMLRSAPAASATAESRSDNDPRKQSSELSSVNRNSPRAKSAGPSRDMQTQFPNVVPNQQAPVSRRQVGGKTFELNQGVWYDRAFSGRPTVNVRRGTSEYKKLDTGLRSIGNSFSGTVVIVWEGKAYRIQ